MSKCCVGRGGGTAGNCVLQFTVYIRYYGSTLEFPPHLNTFLNQRFVFQESVCDLKSVHRSEDRSLTTCVCSDCGKTFKESEYFTSVCYN